MVKNFITKTFLFHIPLITLNERLHYISLIFMTLFCFHNIPYYGVDYLLYGPLGFIYEDKVFEKMSPKTGYTTKFSNIAPPQSFVVNSIPFDQPNKLDKFDGSNNSDILKYEQYSLESERLWKNRFTFQRVEMGNSTKGKSSFEIKNIKLLPFEIPKYDNPELESYDKLKKKN